MSKKWSVILLCLLASSLPILIYASAEPVSVWVDDHEIISDVPAYIDQGRTMVPLRFVSEAFGAQVEWNEAAHKVTIKSRQSLPLLKLNDEPTAWPYLYENGVLYLEYRDTLELLREYNPLRPATYTNTGHWLSVNNRRFDLYYQERNGLTFISISQLQEFNVIKYSFDPESGNLVLLK